MNEDPHTQRTAVQHILESYLGLFSQQRWDEWIDLWAEDGVLEFPFAPPGRRSRYVGKTEILAYMKPLGGRMKSEGVEYYRVHPMLEPRNTCFEVGLKGQITETGATYVQKYISIVETRDGKIVLYREYWNPLVSIDANGGREAWTAGFGQPEDARDAL